MSMAKQHKGMDHDCFLPFLDMVRILNFLQVEQVPSPLYVFENTNLGQRGQYPLVDDATKMVESFSGAPIVVDDLQHIGCVYFGKIGVDQKFYN